MTKEQDYQKLQPVLKGFREMLLADPDRPGYHFCDPEGFGEPGDPNGCFYANGRYHLMYLYRHEEKGYCWGHVSSVDLLHWHHHPDCIQAGAFGRGCYSGGAFLDDDGRCYISFWDFIADEESFGGIRIAVSEGEPYEKWTLFPEFAVRCNVGMGVARVTGRDGREHIVGGADPSNIWKKDGRYYMQTGNLPVLDRYSRGENPPEDLRGDWVDLFSSEDLHDWTYEGRFYDRRECLDTADSEDDMCPSFLPLPAGRRPEGDSGKYLQLFIAHNRGCQYYVGTYDKEADRFHPESHGRMSVTDSAYFAPEALIGPDGRQIMWVWLRDNPKDSMRCGWNGVFSMARELWYDESDGTLRMAPAREYERLQINPVTFDASTFDAPEKLVLPSGTSFRMEIPDIAPEHRGDFELRIRVSEDGEEYTRICFDPEKKELVMDSTKGTTRGWPAVERMPVNLGENEPLTLNLYVDESVVEIYANDRAAIGRRIYPDRQGRGVWFCPKAAGAVGQIRTWEMAPCNPY